MVEKISSSALHKRKPPTNKRSEIKKAKPASTVAQPRGSIVGLIGQHGAHVGRADWSV